MQPSEGFVLDPSPSPNRKSAQDWVIEPWIAAPAQIVVYEYGARLDVRSQALAREQIAKARALYNTLVAFIRTVHAEMNAWVLAQAGAEAQALSERLRACGAEMQRWYEARDQLKTDLRALLCAITRDGNELRRSTWRQMQAEGAALHYNLLAERLEANEDASRCMQYIQENPIRSSSPAGQNGPSKRREL